MDEKPINGKAIYTPKGAALEYGRIGCNFYTGCPHECEYCYLKRGAPSKQLGGTEVRLKKCFKDEEDALRVFEREVKQNLERCQRDGIFFSFTTDPLIAETRWLTMDAIRFCSQHDVPVWVLAKDATFISEPQFVNHLVFLSESFRPKLHIGFTLTGHDEMEPKASSNAERIDAMRRLKCVGFSTFASIEPVIDWESAYGVILDSYDCCDHYKIGLRSGVKKDYYNLATIADDVKRLTDFITDKGKTYYLKESVRKHLNTPSPMTPWDFTRKVTPTLRDKPPTLYAIKQNNNLFTNFFKPYD